MHRMAHREQVHHLEDAVELQPGPYVMGQVRILGSVT